MVFADIIDQIFGYLCFGFVGLLCLIGFVLYGIGSAVGSIFKSDAVREVAEEVAEGTIIGFIESFFDD